MTSGDSGMLPIDPVCGMRVSSDDAATATWGGKAYWFCSAFCRSLFEKSPERYVIAADADLLRVGRPRIAYFSMEIAVAVDVPTYCGGLGVLAGDTLRAGADLGLPVVGLTLLYREGYFRQGIDTAGRQVEEPARWQPETMLRLLPQKARVRLRGRNVTVQAWQYRVCGHGGHEVPVLFLDTDVDGNHQADRELTNRLYGGDDSHRLAQELILGVGGARILRALGHTDIARYHLNEGHAALLAFELLKETAEEGGRGWDFGALRERCVFTTHTPVPAGHDQFDYGMVEDVLGDEADLDVLRMLGGSERLNMTLLGLNASGYVNGVAKRHAEVSRDMFPRHLIEAITNGIHPPTWAAPPIARLLDRHVPEWRADSYTLRAAFRIPTEELAEAHVACKRALLDRVSRTTSLRLEREALTIGFARRATPYKRSDLVFYDLDRLRDIARSAGPIQFIFAGKAHPRDRAGKDLIERIVRVSRELGVTVPVVYLPDYDMELARLLVSGVDVWLNTPRKPLEASGTSGMKAALNGVPSLSVLDGWWLEGHIEGVTGWSIGSRSAASEDDERDAEIIYSKLEGVIAPRFYGHRESWFELMRGAMALNGSYFHTQRMIQQYVASAYTFLRRYH